MIIYVAAGHRKSEKLGWFGSGFAPLIVDIFAGSEILFPPPEIAGTPNEVYYEVYEKIKLCTGAITFATAESAGPLIEAGLLAGLSKPQAVIATRDVLHSKMLRGLNSVIGLADYSDKTAVAELLLLLRQQSD